MSRITSADILKLSDEISQIKDVDTLLDRILTESRKFTSADAASIYLKEKNHLRLNYVQNDTLFSRENYASKYFYTSKLIPIENSSITGYVALTRKTLLIADAYKISDKLPFSTLSSGFDKEMKYHVKSILTVPMITNRGVLIGILQIINKLNKEGGLDSFTLKDKKYAAYFAANAAVAVERASLTREMILRMIRMAELRDPKETGAHVNRVASYSFEIFRELAKRKKIPKSQMQELNENLRIAAMLHDVGKVAISDNILKKPGKLTEDEFEIMKTHTVAGFKLFDNESSELDRISAEICLNHHERWDGKGYPGQFSEKLKRIVPKKGENIPIEARIVALADVYDALISRRVYKEPWDEEDVLRHIRSESGKHFDPDVAESFLAVQNSIAAIRKKYV